MAHPTTGTVDRRRHERVPLRAEVVVSKNGSCERMAVHDVSLSGAFFETTLFDHIDFKTGARVRVTLFVDEDTPIHASEDGHTVHVDARIMRRDPGAPGRPPGLAVVFEHVDLENLEKLRALVHRTS